MPSSQLPRFYVRMHDNKWTVWDALFNEPAYVPPEALAHNIGHAERMCDGLNSMAQRRDDRWDWPRAARFIVAVSLILWASLVLALIYVSDWSVQ